MTTNRFMTMQRIILGAALCIGLITACMVNCRKVKPVVAESIETNFGHYETTTNLRASALWTNDAFRGGATNTIMLPDAYWGPIVGDIVISCPPDQIIIPITTNMSIEMASNIWHRIQRKQAAANEVYANDIERRVAEEKAKR